MDHGWSMVLSGSLSVLCLLGISPAWGMPNYHFDKDGGKGWPHGKHDYEYDYDEKHAKEGKFGGYENNAYEKWPRGEDWGDFEKWSYGYGKHGGYWKDDQIAIHPWRHLSPGACSC